MSASADRASSGEHERGPRTEPMSIGETTIGHPLDRVCTVLAVAGIALLAIRRWTLVGPFPPGLDGAQWLALGRGMDGQAIGRSTEGAYAPLVPVLAATAEFVAGPLSAVRLLAAASSLVLSLAVWFVARGALGSVWGLIVTSIVIPASALAEPTLFGGYPQQFALAAGIIALWAVCRYLSQRSGISGVPTWPTSVGATPAIASPMSHSRDVTGFQDSPLTHVAVSQDRSLVLVGIAALLTAAAHHIYFPVVTLAILAAVGLRLADRSRMNDLARSVRSLALALAPALALFAALAFAFMRAGYAAPLDASARSFVDAWEYGTRESSELWLVILATGVVGLAIRRQVQVCGDAARLVAVSLVMPAGLLFFLSGQPRLLPPILIGAGIAAGLCARWVASIGPRAHAATLLFAIAIAAALVIPADRASTQFADFYRVVDEPLVRAAAVIESDGNPGAIAVRKDRRGWPIGWWFEALVDRPVIVGSDPRWLAFPAEREHARQADALFDGGLDSETFRQRAIASGVRYLVIAKWDWIGWERWLTTPGFPVATLYDDDRYLVLRIS